MGCVIQCKRCRADPHPGNIAVDAEQEGRLIYYDFGMMGTIPGDVREGLLELFYGVYQKDPDRHAILTMTSASCACILLAQSALSCTCLIAYRHACGERR